MPEEFNFDNIRPYTEEEAKGAIQRITHQDEFQAILDYIFDKKEHNLLKKEASEAKTIHEFQKAFMGPLVRNIQNKTTDGVSASGFENLKNVDPRLFIANHRDITLDSSILANQMVEHGLETCEVTWGDNLMVSPFVVDFGKINRMITVFREGSPREMLVMSQRLSAYIRHSISEKKKSVWIAQSKGRTKDGNDKTDIGVLKMLMLSGKDSLLENIKELNITPVTISFEWEPCDTLKLRELYISIKEKYIKEKTEDLNSIIGGITGHKGHIHISIGNSINTMLNHYHESLSQKDLLKEVSGLIDLEIYRSFKLWPTHYYAYDLLFNTTKFNKNYSDLTAKLFNERKEKALKKIGNQISDYKTAESIFLKIYANPVINKIDNGFLE
ncbi:MAG: acyltransferase [Bacteroidales bacterium]|nr:acyltransferase [Bacteroidales bacterium]